MGVKRFWLALLASFLVLAGMAAADVDPTTISSWYSDGCVGEQYCPSTDKNTYIGQQVLVYGKITNNVTNLNIAQIGFFSTTNSPLVFNNFSLWLPLPAPKTSYADQNFQTTNYKPEELDVNGGSIPAFELDTGNKTVCWKVQGGKCSYTFTVATTTAPLVWQWYAVPDLDKLIDMSPGTISAVLSTFKNGWQIVPIVPGIPTYWKADVSAPVSVPASISWEFFVKIYDPITGNFGLLDPTIVAANYSYYKNIQIDVNASSTLNEFDFPMPLDGNQGFNTNALITAVKMDSSCSSLELAESDSNSNILRWDWANKNDANNLYGCNGTSTEIWYDSNLPKNTDVNTVHRMYYGNAGDSTDDNQDAKVWDKNYIFVGHFQNGKQTTTYVHDSTKYDNNGDFYTVTAPLIPGVFGYAYNFNGNSRIQVQPRVPLPGDKNFWGSNKYTIAEWIKLTAGIGGGSPSIAFGYNAGGGTAQGIAIQSSATSFRIDYSASSLDCAMPLDTLTWYFVVGTYDNTTSTVSCWINGQKVATTSGTYTLNQGAICINGRSAVAPFQSCTDTIPSIYVIDEVRISDTLRDANWIQGVWAQGKYRLGAVGAEQSNSSAVVPNYLDIRGPAGTADANYDGNNIKTGADYNLAFSFQVGDINTAAETLNVDINVGTTAGGGIGTKLDSNVRLNGDPILTGTDGRVVCTSGVDLVAHPFCTFNAKLNALADGNYFIKINLFDHLRTDGNIFKDSNSTFMIDNNVPWAVAPTLSGVTTYQNGTIGYLGAGTVTYDANAWDGGSGFNAASSCAGTVNEQTYGAITNLFTNAQTVHCSGTQAVANATSYVFGGRITDRAGNIGTSTFTTAYQGDTTAPTTTATGFTHNTWATAHVQVTLTCNDGNGSGCASTRYKLDTNPALAVSLGAWTTYAAPFDVPGDGNFEIDFNSTDNVGNVETTQSKYVLVDTNKPGLAFSGFTHNTWSLTASPSVTLTCTDTNGSAQTSGCNVTKYSLDTSSALGKTMPNRATYSGAFTVSGDGNFAIDANSNDTAGNEGSIVEQYVLVDTNKPSTTATDANSGGTYIPGDWSTSNVTVTLSCTDTNASAQTSGCQTSNTLYCTDGTNTCTPTTTYTAPFVVSSEGTTYVRYDSNDNANNLETTKSHTVKIDKTGPVVGTPTLSGTTTYTNAGNNWTGSGTVTYTSTATDATANIDTATCQGSSNEGGSYAAGTYNANTCYTTQIVASGTGYVFSNRVNDQAGLLTTSAFTVNYSGDTTAPTTTATGFTHNTWATAHVQVTLTCNDGNGSGCASTIYRVDTNPALAVSMGSWQTYTVPFDIPGDGNFQVDYNSSDNVGNVETVNSKYVLVDTRTPTTTFGGFTTNSWTLTAPITTTLTCTDTNGSAQTSNCTTYYVLDTNPALAFSGNTTTTYASPFNTTGDGNFRIDFNSVDGAGNAEAVNIKYALLDTWAPITTQNFGHNAWQNTAPLTTTLTCSDTNTLSVTAQTSTCNSTIYRTDTSSALAATMPATWTAYASFNVPGDGNWQIDFNSNDVVGNVEAVKNRYALLDTKKPVTAIDYNNWSDRLGQKQKWLRADQNTIWTACSDVNALDAAAQVSACTTEQYKADTDPSVGTSLGAWTDWNSGRSFASDGNFRFDFNSRDAAGNTEDTNIVYFLHDIGIPTLSLTQPGNNPNSKDIIFDLNDAFSGVKTAHVYVDGVVSPVFSFAAHCTQPGADRNFHCAYTETSLIGDVLQASTLKLVADDNAFDQNNTGTLSQAFIYQPQGSGGAGGGGGGGGGGPQVTLPPAPTLFTITNLPNNTLSLNLEKLVPTNQPVQIKNIGTQPLVYSVIISPGLSAYISSDKLAGTIQPGQIDTIQLTFTIPSGTPDGILAGTLTVQDKDRLQVTPVATNLQIGVGQRTAFLVQLAELKRGLETPSPIPPLNNGQALGALALGAAGLFFYLKNGFLGGLAALSGVAAFAVVLA